MYKEIPSNFEPKDESIKIWRYIDFTKFVSLLVSKSLYFARAKNFEDNFEGARPKAFFENIPDTAFTKVLSEIRELSKSDVAINCWHASDYESVAMWKIYGEKGIAIQSTYERLKSSTTNEKTVFFGAVQYINYEKDIFAEADNSLLPFFYKRNYFAYEQEIRAVVVDIPNMDMDSEKDPYENLGHGFNIKTDIQTLVETIYISPDLPDWFFDLVQSVSKTYGYDFDVVHSKLKDEPLF